MTLRAPRRIRLLTDAVKKKIAAGEVVEGPFSVVKELVENALDAGATRIDVQVWESGLKKIMVTDDGCGIARDDIELAIAEHATSKIEEAADIERVGTFGFRGEALSSISSIARLTILSRAEADPLGARLFCDEGAVSVGDYAGPRGTTIVVENLFYTVPARKKFLKAHRSEQKAIRDTMLRSAIPHHGVAFSLAADDKRQFVLAAAPDRGERIRQVLGAAVADDLTCVSLQDVSVSLQGWFAGPATMKSNRALQFLYVNGRPVEYRYLGGLMQRAYEAVAPRGQHPVCVIFIDLDPGLVDVNIHPAKKEVKLFDHRYIDGLLIALAGKALAAMHRVPDRLFGALPAHPEAPPRDCGRHDAPPSEGERQMAFSVPSACGAVHEHRTPWGGFPASSGGGPSAPAAAGAPAATADDRRVLGILFDTYVLVEEGERLVIIDYHAAHERLIFDRLMAAEERPVSQGLAFPEIVECAPGDHRTIVENIELFTQFGFDIDAFSDTAIIINAVPGDIVPGEARALIEELLRSLHDGSAPPDLRHAVAATVACRSAHRAGGGMRAHDAAALAAQILTGGHELRCPHGRPLVYTIGRGDLERMFKRA